jgi:hypothetical protein
MASFITPSTVTVTADGTYKTVDLGTSDSVPADATCIFHVVIDNDYKFAMRQPGSTDDWYQGYGTSSDLHGTVFCAVDGDSEIEIKVETGATFTISLHGWLESDECVWFENAQDVTIGTYSTWDTVGVGAFVPAGALGVIVEGMNINGSGTYDAFFRARPEGASWTGGGAFYTRHRNVFMVGLNDDLEFDVAAYEAAADIYVLAYITENVVFFDEPFQVDDGTTGSWTTVDINTELAAIDAAYGNAEMVFCTGTDLSNSSVAWGVRYPSDTSVSADNLPYRNGFMAARCDGSGDFEFYDTNCSIWCFAAYPENVIVNLEVTPSIGMDVDTTAETFFSLSVSPNVGMDVDATPNVVINTLATIAPGIGVVATVLPVDVAIINALTGIDIALVMPGGYSLSILDIKTGVGTEVQLEQGLVVAAGVGIAVVPTIYANLLALIEAGTGVDADVTADSLNYLTVAPGVGIDTDVTPAEVLQIVPAIGEAASLVLQHVVAIEDVIGVQCNAQISRVLIQELDAVLGEAAEVIAQHTINVDAGVGVADVLTMFYNRSVAVAATLGVSAEVLPAMVVSLQIDPGIGVDTNLALEKQFFLSVAAGVGAKVRLYLDDGVGGTYHVFNLNYETGGLTRYSGWRFDSFCEFDGDYFGAGPDGLMHLEGDDDDGTDIPVSLTTSMVRSSKRVNVPEMFVAMSNAGTVYIKTVTDDGNERTYQVAPTAIATQSAGAYPVVRQVELAMGLQSTYWTFKLETTDGEDIEIDSLDWRPAKSSREI